MKILILCSLFLFSNTAQAAKRISVLTYNVENLFDTKHDEGKTDFTFLPLKDKSDKKIQRFCKKVPRKEWREQCLYLDWNEEALSKKMTELKASLLQANNGKGADIVFLQEVENVGVLSRFNELLGNKKYDYVILLEGRDLRGIDVAVLTKLPVVSTPQLYKVKFSDNLKKLKEDSRGILEVNLKLPDGQMLTIFSNHFPAPFHNKQFRIDSFQTLNQILTTFPRDRYFIAGGDFNIPSEEDKKFSILKKHVEPLWLVSHKIGCESCQGTQYYSPKKSWSFLDMILLSKNFEDGKGWEVDKKTIQVLKGYKNQLETDGTPKSFDPKSGVGVSDHLPVYLEIFKK